MAGTVEDVLRIARSQLGETSGRKYFEEMGDAWWGQAWCARFGRWVFWKAGVDCHWDKDYAFDERDVPQQYRVDKYDLQPAYPLCFDWADSSGYRDGKGDHFGIVESVQDWGCVTLEGNAGIPGKVRREQRVWDCIICGIRPTFAQSKAQWIKEDGRWWYRHADGSYTRNGWECIDGKWYYFDHEGWMLASTCVNDGTGWYALGASGAMLTDLKTHTAHDGRYGAIEL
jgi:hypothetical protein